MDETRGPNGEVVLFTHVAAPLEWADAPPYGLIYIRSIIGW